MDWQPIETAPRDGARILVSDGKSVTEGYWRRGWWIPATILPTHWMPLPPPPQTP